MKIIKQTHKKLKKLNRDILFNFGKKNNRNII
jgi:hypothetical protein